MNSSGELLAHGVALLLLIYCTIHESKFLRRGSTNVVPKRQQNLGTLIFKVVYYDSEISKHGPFAHWGTGCIGAPVKTKILIFM